MAETRKPGTIESTEIECPWRLEYKDTLPDGVRLTHHDRFSMFMSFGKDTTLCYQSDKDTMASCILYHHPTRTRWNMYFTPKTDENRSINPDFMTTLIEMHDKGLF